MNRSIITTSLAHGKSIQLINSHKYLLCAQIVWKRETWSLTQRCLKARQLQMNSSTTVPGSRRVIVEEAAMKIIWFKLSICKEDGLRLEIEFLKV